ncbi:MAG TPA: cyclase family protein [Bacilli bacterium]|nr:cyclase family protein [Bacilli bacterium]HPT89706.1 cyclase family protein [Bacilli bacterium]HQD92756.1 cyclase family protein [Bacilli bacterium]
MKIYDISMTIHPNMQVYKNKEEKKPIFITRANHINSHVHETSITIDLHTGTHIDAPLHMLKDGATTETYDFKYFITTAKVFDFSNKDDVIAKDDLLTKEISENDFILLKTKNSFSDDFDYNFVYLSGDAAKYLVSKKIIGVGIDGLGIERNQPTYDTHKSLLSNKVMILEGLRLKEVLEGSYKLIILPLKIANVEASPARAILIED